MPPQSDPGGVAPRPTRRARSLLVTITLGGLLVGSARAQTEGPADELPFDATGPDVPPQRIDAPMTLWAADTMDRGSSRFAALAEGAGGLLFLEQPDGEASAAVSLAAGLAVSGGFALTDRIEVGASASLWRVEPAGRFAAGAVRVDVPVSLLDGGASDAAVGLTPWVGVPVGSPTAGVASPGVSGGLVAAARVPADRVELNANLGVSTRSRRSFPNPEVAVATQTIGGPSVDFGAAVGLRPRGGWRADVEFRGAWSLAAGALDTVPDDAGVPESDVFAEALLTGGGPLVRRGNGAGGLGWRAGAGLGLTTGIGTSLGRGFLALTWTDGVDVRPDGDDGAADRKWRVVVTGRLPGGTPQPLGDASVRIGTRELGRTAADGSLDVVGLKALVRPEDPTSTAPPRVVSVNARGWEGDRVQLPETPDIVAGARILAVELGPLPRDIPTRVTSPTGIALTARVKGTSEGREPIDLPASSLALGPGRWVLTFSAEGYGSQVRTIDVPVVEAVPPVEVVLRETQGEAALVHTVRDAQGNPVSGATVLLDGLPVGVTGPDGTLVIEGLAEGEHAVSVDHPAFSPVAEQVTLGEDGPVEVESGVDRVPGTVRVVAVDGRGRPVQDAVVRFAGPRRLAPMPLGEDGERSEVLGEGTWTLLVSSVEFGFQQRQVVVPADRYEPIDVRVVLRPDEGGEARLAIRVVDPLGIPVEGALIALDGEPLGTTSTGGVLALDGLTSGQRSLTVSGEQHVAIEPVPVVLIDGLQEEVVTLPWKPGSVRISVRTPQGPVTDASVRFAGPSSIAPVPLGRSGRATLQLDPGDWSVLVTSPEHGIQQRQVTIAEVPGGLAEVDIVLSTTEAGLAVLGLDVRDPEGFPVSGAAVFLDSVPLGTTSNGTLRAEGLAVGKRELQVEAPFFRAFNQSLQLLEDDQEVVAALEWAPGAVQVRVLDSEGNPVPDGVVRLLGQRAVPPTPVGSDGKALFELEPGEWQALAISPTLGMTQVPVLVEAVPEDGGLEGLQVVDITLTPVQKGLADVVVRVVDDAGVPVAGATVAVDEEAQGTTPTGGILSLRNLLPGTSTFSVRAPGYAPARVELDVVEGSQVRYVELVPLPGRLDVTATGPDGKPVNAEIALVGPEDWLPTKTGRDGRYTFHIRPGDWRVVAKAKRLGAASKTATVVSEQRSAVELQLQESRVRVGASGVVLEDVVLFDFDATTLRDGAQALLDEVASTLQSQPEIVSVEVRGHTDDRGDLTYNLELSQRRAESVRLQLIERGVPPEILTARGYGASRPAQSNDTEAGRAANRRVEFVLGN